MAPDPRLAATFARASRATAWALVGEVPLQFDAHHPQGMVRIDGSWWITTVDITDRAGWLLVVAPDGKLHERIRVGDDVRFHPGGFDFDGESLWVASSEYRPRSSAVIERLAVEGATAGRAEAVFGVDDHVGGIVRLGADGDLFGWTWGSRRFLRWTIAGTELEARRHPSQFVDYQDGQWLGGDLVVCGGVATIAGPDGPVSLGGFGLVHGEGLWVEKEVPFPGYSPTTRRPSTQNPLYAEVKDDHVLLHLLPDDGRGTILTYAGPVVR